MKNKNVFSIKEIIFIIIITGVVTSLTTGSIIFKKETSNLIKDEEVNKFIEAYNQVTSDYVDELNKEEVVQSAIDGMMDYLGDNYSVYLDKEESNHLKEELTGTFEGIGIEISPENKIVQVYEGTPAAKAGLQANDIILSINGKEVTTSKESVELIKDTKDIKISIKRREETLKFDVKKDTINKKIAISKQLEDNIGYLHLSGFTNNAYDLFYEELMKLEEGGMKKLIIDLRFNTGGYLAQAKKIANIFLKKNQTIYYLEDKNNLTTYKDTTEEHKDYEIVVLANGSTASASEVLIAALKENKDITIIGDTTYGKGKVQQQVNNDDGTILKYTTSYWLTPKKFKIDGIGIKPDIAIAYDYENNIDTQLNKAIKYLK